MTFAFNFLLLNYIYQMSHRLRFFCVQVLRCPIFLMFVLVWGMSGCAPLIKPQAQMANPAAVACVKAGGRVVISSTTAGEQGMCHLPSGEVCDEWAFFRYQPSSGKCPQAMSSEPRVTP